MLLYSNYHPGENDTPMPFTFHGLRDGVPGSMFASLSAPVETVQPIVYHSGGAIWKPEFSEHASFQIADISVEDSFLRIRPVIEEGEQLNTSAAHLHLSGWKFEAAIDVHDLAKAFDASIGLILENLNAVMFKSLSPLAAPWDNSAEERERAQKIQEKFEGRNIVFYPYDGRYRIDDDSLAARNFTHIAPQAAALLQQLETIWVREGVGTGYFTPSAPREPSEWPGFIEGKTPLPENPFTSHECIVPVPGSRYFGIRCERMPGWVVEHHKPAENVQLADLEGRISPELKALFEQDPTLLKKLEEGLGAYFATHHSAAFDNNYMRRETALAVAEILGTHPSNPFCEPNPFAGLEITPPSPGRGSRG